MSHIFRVVNVLRSGEVGCEFERDVDTRVCVWGVDKVQWSRERIDRVLKIHSCIGVMFIDLNFFTWLIIVELMIFGFFVYVCMIV